MVEHVVVGPVVVEPVAVEPVPVNRLWGPGVGSARGWLTMTMSGPR